MSPGWTAFLLTLLIGCLGVQVLVLAYVLGYIP